MTGLAWRPLLVLGAASVLIQLSVAAWGSFGIFIDEFYYVACARRLAWGYVDHPPLAVALLRLVIETLGHSQVALRVVPALCGAATIFLSGRFAARLGASTRGQVLAAGLTGLAPALLVLFGVFTTNALDILLWVIALSLFFELERGSSPRTWLWLGACLGLAQLTKHTSFLLAICVGVAVFLIPLRAQLRTRWPWLGVALAVLLVMPNVIWEIQNDWITMEFVNNAILNKNLQRGPAEVLVQQVMFNGPGAVLLWLGGLGLLLFGPVKGRGVGLVALLLILLLIVSQQSRPDRIAAVYPLLFGAGGALWSRLSRVPWGRGLQAVAVAVAVLPTLMILPMFLPVLSPDATARWANVLGLDVQLERGAGKRSALPQWLADRMGWEEFVSDAEAAVVRARSRLSPQQLESLVIVANSYGHAGALELLGGPTLPPVHATQNNYILWGPPLGEIDAMIVFDDSPERLSELFGHVELLDVHDCEHCMPWRDQLPMWLVWGPRFDFRGGWMELRHLE